LYELLDEEAERETMEATNPELVMSQAESFKALLREASNPL
jgi:hypothetical protein